MKVKEAIEILKQFDQEAELICYDKIKKGDCSIEMLFFTKNGNVLVSPQTKEDLSKKGVKMVDLLKKAIKKEKEING